MSFRNTADVLAYLNRFTDYERMSPVRATPRSFNLGRMRRLLKRIGNPENSFGALHIAGTKGKGSVTLFAESLLRGCGIRTGAYLSPHLLDMTERIQVGGRPVSPREFVAAMNRIRRGVDRVRPTYFEIMTAAAFTVFAERGVEVAVVEVGLGGRLDSTNVLAPVGCAITRIEKDHMKTLGTTLGAIAREKAGILKPGIPVVTAPQRPTVERVIFQEARRLGVPLLSAPRIERARTHWRRTGFVVDFWMEDVCWRIPVAGAHQAGNAAVALGLVRVVANPSRSVIRKSLGRVRLPGRIDLVGRRPDVVVDVAHNPASAAALQRTLREVAPKRKKVLVFGTPSDKDARSILRELLPGTRLAIFTRSDNPRATAPERLSRLARGKRGVVVRSVPRAVELARKVARRGELVVVAGSFAVAGEALARLQ